MIYDLVFTFPNSLARRIPPDLSTFGEGGFVIFGINKKTSPSLLKGKRGFRKCILIIIIIASFLNAFFYDL